MAAAIRHAMSDHPLLLSPKARQRVLELPDAADGRLVPIARDRIRELYPEIERQKRRAEQPFCDRDHPAVRLILDGYYPGSGGGRPRVPRVYPVLLDKIERGLLDVALSADSKEHPDLKQLGDDAMDCYSLCSDVNQTCGVVRERGRELSAELRRVSMNDTSRLRASQAEVLDDVLDAGELPYANSQILPVGPYGMSPKWGLDPLVLQFAKDNQSLYEEIDRYGQTAMGWARRIARRARALPLALRPRGVSAEPRHEDSDLPPGEADRVR
ncbi:hypothetical protein [Patulibacter defluvii]|uniref:hypothetical protein n=1 Tax=Patulibacter defluvii TaxID=3095358 RepID=UPI002A7536BF|nr:hypothetical protein [Patulibacter sp. DM4]